MTESQTDLQVYHPDVNCAVLAIDLRGSTRDASHPSRTPTAEAKRVSELFRAVRSSSKTCPPNFVKSTGDGLMCFWHLDVEGRDSTGNDLRLKLLEAVLKLAIKLDKSLATELGEALHTKRSQNIGMGLAFGAVAKGFPPLNDYFGYTANLSAKLQDRARPGGLVIQDAYLAELGDPDYPELETKKVLPSSSLAEFHVKNCHVTSAVQWMTDWTCLAWSGFASSFDENQLDKRSQDGERHRRTKPRGLNTKGLTVLTHEGLQGKIGTLEIWPRDVEQPRGDCFELIIDDFDSLSIMVQQRSLFLMRRDESRLKVYKRALAQICPSVCDAEDTQDFLFIPIRCGINSVLWNAEQLPSFGGIASYSELHSFMQEDAHTLSPPKIGLYDNLGATLPLLIMALSDPQDAWTMESFYRSGTDPNQFNRILDLTCSRARKLTQSHGKFTLFSKAEHLANKLRIGRISLALGGGRWLMEDTQEDLDLLRFGLPEVDGGLLWVEGASLTERADPYAPEIVQFLSKNVLDNDYQLSLAYRDPYGSSPVTKSAIGEILTDKERNSPADDETRVIFATPSKVSAKLVHRRTPSNLSAALDAWSQILRDCCEVEGKR